MMSSFNAQLIENASCCGLQQNLTSEFKQEDVDAILAQGMQHLNFDELQREQEVLHGVGDLVLGEEKNQERLSLLQRFDDRLQRRKKCTVYESAEVMNRAYVTNLELRMHFLYGNRWDPEAAADQFLRFLEMKKQLFGMDKVVKDLTLNDLDKDDKENLLGGSLQILPCTDRSGRSIILELPGLRSFKHLRNELRARFYMCVNLWSQTKRGVVWISYAVGQYRDTMNGKGFVETTKMMMCMPDHCAGIHLCTDDPSEAVICKAAMALTSAEWKAKTRIHYGSHTECQYLLNTFGIPRVALPFTMRNEAILEDHMAWYKQCLNEEHTSTGGTSVVRSQLDPPNQNDVLFAGRKFSENGNEELRLMAMQYFQSYVGGNPRERRAIVDTMVGHISRKGGRFLKLDDDPSSAWVEVPMAEVREKIVQMFRNLRRPRAPQQKKTRVATSSHLPLLDETEIASTDILFGRRFFHDGNQRLRDMVESLASEYDAATRGRKKQLVDSLIEEIKSSSGRFLRQVKGGKWQEVSDDSMILSKVSSHFRNYRRSNRDLQEK
ncbi:unnamed protein product [Cylindrotheca closterium]|uniref:DUF6824 domain-containing protein n=1 Tax=Cylindrotheca closterium TaxID=2856 RepID=A0AAD2CEY1_9STRA|nr:unnamed protein product [Cylindrotheca closterium]